MDEEARHLRAYGGTSLDLRTAMGGIGLAVALSNWSTKVTVDEQAGASRPPGALGPRGLEF